MKYIEAKVRVNKNNKQFNLNLPKRQLTKRLISDILSKGKVRIKIEG